MGGTSGEAGEGFGGDFGEFDAALDVSDQSSDGSVVTVARASLEPTPGWVVIYTDEADSPAQPIGRAEVEANLTDIEVPLDEPLGTGEHKLWAQMHVDAEPVGQFQFPGDDLPVTGEDGDVVHASFTLTVEG